MEQISNKLLNWASVLDEGAKEQALKVSRLPFIDGHVALMPDAHWGMGATVGSVIPTRGAIIPAAVGVDIGCGMCAIETSLFAKDLPDNMNTFFPIVRATIPAGVGQGHGNATVDSLYWFNDNPPETEAAEKLKGRAMEQFGSLGSGNHFFEVCLDETDRVWLVLHSGSRGVGNVLATQHIETARGLMKQWYIELEDKDLAYLVQDTPEFTAYITDMLWAQKYAQANRDTMMNAVSQGFFAWIGTGFEQYRINCHHNFTRMENHNGRNVWVTRKGAIQAFKNDFGIIPGSMGAATYIVQGLGNEASYCSCSHGAGRLLGRQEAYRQFTGDDLRKAMEGKAWQDRDADALVDESPMAYKDIDQVMEDQKDLVKIEHTLHQILNYKGVEDGRRKKKR